MQVREPTRDDLDAWVALRCALWPGEDEPDLRADALASYDGGGWRAAVFVCEHDGALVGVIELSLRVYAEGCDTSPVPFMEGWFVTEPMRGKGVGRALVRAAENWARTAGYTEMGSDTQLWNTGSQAAHMALGFEEAERVVAFRKAL